MTNPSFDLLDLLNDLPVTSGEITRDETSISWRKVKLNLAVNRSAAPSPESVHDDLPDFEDVEDTVTGSQAVDRTEDNDYDGDENEEIEVAVAAEGSEAFDCYSPVSEPELPDTAAASHGHAADSSLESAIHALSSMHVSRSTALPSAEKSSRFEVEDPAFASSTPFGDEPSSSLEDLAVPPTPRLRHIHLPRPVAPTPTASPALGLDFSSPIDLTQDGQDDSDQFIAVVHNDEQVDSSRSQEAETSSTLERPVRREGRYETVYGLNIDDEGYFEVRRPGIPRWSTSKSPQSRRKHRELSLHPRIQSLINVIPRDHRNYPNTWLKKNDRVKRVVEARERRYLRHPEVIPDARGSFVKKAIERFGPTWRPQLPRFFNKILKHASDAVEDPSVSSYAQLPAASLAASSVTTADSEMDTTMNASSPPAPTSGNVGPHLTAHPSITTQAPTNTALPYLSSHTASDTQGHYPYIVTPPIEPVGLPQLTPGPSSSGVPTPCIPTPSSGQITLPTLPPFVHLPGPTSSSSLIPPSMDAQKKDYGRPVAYGTDSSQQSTTVRAPVAVRPTTGSVGLPYLVSDAQRMAGSGDVPYIVTPPLPSSTNPTTTQPPAVGLPYLASDSRRTFGGSDVPYIATPPLPSSSVPATAQSVPTVPLPAPPPPFAANSMTVNQSSSYVSPPPPQPFVLPTAPAPQLSMRGNSASIAPPFPAMDANQQVQHANFSPLPQTAPGPVPTQRPQPPQLKLPTLPPLVLPPQPPSLQPPLQRPQPSQLKVPIFPSLVQASPPPHVSQAFPPYATSNAVPQQFIIPTQRSVIPPLVVPLPPTTFPYNSELLYRGTLRSAMIQQVDSMDCAEDGCAGQVQFEGNVPRERPDVDMESPVQQSLVPEFVVGDGVTQAGGGLQGGVEEGQCIPALHFVEPCGGATQLQFGAEANPENVIERAAAEDVEGGLYGQKLGVVDEEGAGTPEENTNDEDEEDEDSLSGDPPPFDETDPLWEELLTYNATSTAEGGLLHEGSETPLEPEDRDHGGNTRLPLADEDVIREHVEESFAADEKCDLWSGMNDQDGGNVNTESDHDELSESLWAWATQSEPEIVDQFPGLVGPTQDGPSVTPNKEAEFESPSFTDIPPFKQDHSHTESLPKASPSTEPLPPQPEHPSPLPTITVELVDSCPPPEATQPETHETEQQSSFSSTFILDELDWEVIEEYARLENIKLPCSSYAAACIMVDAIQAVAGMRITALLTNCEVGGDGIKTSSLFSQSLEELLAGTSSPSYVYTPLDPSCDPGYAYGCSDLPGAQLPPQFHAFAVS